MKTRWLVLTALLLAAAAPALAQDRPRPAVEAGVAWFGFTDDGIVSEAAIAGAGRWYVSPRISLGPEAIYISGDNHSHFVLTGNVTFDLMTESDGGPAAIPFLVVGGGMFQTRESFPGETFTSTEGAFTAGGGVRMRVGPRVRVGADLRVGWELHLRACGFVSVEVGR